MFERGKGSGEPERSAIPVELGLVDGTVVPGKLLVPGGKSLAEILNGTANFLELEPYTGERQFVAKTHISTIKPVDVPKVPNLGTRLRDLDGFDPHRILGLPACAGKDEVRRAYLTLAKSYHPDRYATADLPDEVREYLAGMVRRINAAREALEASLQNEARRVEPIFASPQR